MLPCGIAMSGPGRGEKSVLGVAVAENSKTIANPTRNESAFHCRRMPATLNNVRDTYSRRGLAITVMPPSGGCRKGCRKEWKGRLTLAHTVYGRKWEMWCKVGWWPIVDKHLPCCFIYLILLYNNSI